MLGDISDPLVVVSVGRVFGGKERVRWEVKAWYGLGSQLSECSIM